jgi:hypothetical protein
LGKDLLTTFDLLLLRKGGLPIVELYYILYLKMINNINKERQCSMYAITAQTCNKNQWQGAQTGSTQKRDRAQGNARAS